jgi:hypothetical protein
MLIIYYRNLLYLKILHRNKEKSNRGERCNIYNKLICLKKNDGTKVQIIL